jgi:hypothetical protein
MRTWAVPVLVVLSCADAYADETSLHMRRLDDAPSEPLLHLDIMPLSAEAEGGLMDGRTATVRLGPRARLSAEGRWWQSGLAPSMFAEDLQVHGWRMGGELSYDLGPFSVGANVALDRVGSSSKRTVGLFAFRTFRLSRWMHAWIMLGVSYEQWEGAGTLAPRSGTTVGLSLGTTFR